MSGAGVLVVTIGSALWTGSLLRNKYVLHFSINNYGFLIRMLCVAEDVEVAFKDIGSSEAISEEWGGGVFTSFLL